jgi:hypothetical protein
MPKFLPPKRKSYPTTTNTNYFIFKNVENFQTYAITDLCPNFNSPKERVTLLNTNYIIFRNVENFQKDAINHLCPNFYSPKERYPSTLSASTLITLFSEMLKFSKKL